MLSSLASSVDDRNSICDQCSSIPWASLTKYEPYRCGVDISEITESHDRLKQSGCQMCRLLATIKPPNLDRSICKLRAFPAWEALRWPYSLGMSDVNTKGDNSVIVGICGEDFDTFTFPTKPCLKNGCLGIIGAGQSLEKSAYLYSARRVSSSSINIDFVKECMSFCLQNHIDVCCHPSASDIEGFRVIDCWMKSIVPAPANCKYVTLSYVWGKAQPKNDSGFSFESCSPVVRDGISLVVSLGYRYLWVDRYCINQNDPNKILLINQMDQIYLGSILTIIAAAGQDAGYGLPGVGNRQRIQQQSVKLSDATLVQIFPHASQDLLGSKWATRAWTYQEGYLAARRLIFTDHQASFLCNKIYSSESTKVPLTAPEEEENAPFHGIIPTALITKGLFNSERPVSNLTAVRYILKHMREFSRRHLSHDSDSLNAFLGILHSFETNRILIRHIWGVPFGLDKPWIMLNWFHERPAVRREGLPSWSWVGWKGEVFLVARGDFDCFYPERCGIHIQARLTDGTTALVQDSIGKQRVGQLSPSLQVKGLMVELSLRTFNWDQKTLDATTKTTHFKEGRQLWTAKRRKNGPHCLFELNDRTTALTLVFLDTLVIPEGKLYGLIGVETMMDGQYIFLLKDRGGFYERVGFTYMDCWKDETFTAYIDSASGEILSEVTITPKCQRWLERGEVREFELR